MCGAFNCHRLILSMKEAPAGGRERGIDFVELEVKVPYNVAPLLPHIFTEIMPPLRGERGIGVLGKREKGCSMQPFSRNNLLRGERLQ